MKRNSTNKVYIHSDNPPHISSVIVRPGGNAPFVRRFDPMTQKPAQRPRSDPADILQPGRAQSGGCVSITPVRRRSRPGQEGKRSSMPNFLTPTQRHNGPGWSHGGRECHGRSNLLRSSELEQSVSVPVMGQQNYSGSGLTTMAAVES
ncbi:hypothetical protein VZT92_021655 [Zoarces viviparus]|uniref:Uncharacterized protein n=1 Tax=Zoarces viviparus TaxID=48416 RepID=A0AAW1E9Q0_ZOAVI